MRLVSAIYPEFYPFDFMPIFKEKINTSNPDMLKNGDVLLVWGGEDISPSLYNRPVSPLTGAGAVPSYRDEIEWALMQRAKELGIPIIGICRGAQMLCAASGGYLIQDVDNHAIGRAHEVDTHDGKTLVVNSLHHQMMAPWEVDHKLLAWASEPRSKGHYVDGHDTLPSVPNEPEFVFFPETKGYAVQWHPEFLDYPMPSTDYVFNYIKETIEHV